MRRPEPRRYYSPTRREQADATRRAIVDAARRLLRKNGYGAMTIAAVAAEAGVAVQTIYAIFGSKRGILKGMIERAVFGLEYDRLIAAWEKGKPADRLRFAARIAAEIFGAERAELDFLREAGVADPEASAIDAQRDSNRYLAQRAMIGYLDSEGLLRADITAAAAHDILWTLTGREIFLSLTGARGWSVARYEKWLGDLLVKELLASRPARRRRTSKRGRRALL